MRHVREILRLSLEAGLSTRMAGERAGVGPTTVRDMLKRFARSGLNWPVPAEMSDADLEACLYGLPGMKPGRRKQPEPDWSAVARELKRKHVTLQVLWEEYVAAHPDGYRYSRWCDLFRRWEGRLPLTMRQSHAGGEKMFVDYAGDTVPVVVDRRTGEVRDAHLFVAVLGGSSLSFGCATWTEQFADWIEAHNGAFAFFGGVAHLLVYDYVPGHVIGVLFPARLCAPQPVDPSVLNDIEAHNDQRPASHSRSFGSLCQTGFRGGPTEEVEGT
ncbi:hypothetical protein MesoLjLb_67480 [Mesorhizobium sp. L-8-3]|nr:hypothetical protein MesoLjLb_67480 [Mesorhizobium sp. L-8-3]